MHASDAATVRTGLIYGLAAYGIWGIVPVYFKLVGAIPPRELLAHRIVWSALFLLGLLAITGKLRAFANVFSNRRALGMLALSTMFIAGNWYVFIYSVMTNQILQGSLGYFILPLVNVAFGTLFFGEKMRPPQWAALIFATGGVLVLILWLGIVPWIPLTLAFSFSIYGIIRKHAPVEGTVGLTVETVLLSPIALTCLLFWANNDGLVFGNTDGTLDAMVVLSGLITSVPLIFFAKAVQRLRLVTIGFLQYISPTLAFSIAVLVYHEPFPLPYQVGYGLIWCGLAIFVGEALYRGWRSRRPLREERRQEELLAREMEIMS